MNSRDSRSKILAVLEDFLVWAIDHDHEWWPFLHWRPARDEQFTTDLCAKMTLVYGTIALVLALVVMFLERADFRLLPAFALSVYAAIFVIHRFGFALAWNRRAKRLRSE